MRFGSPVRFPVAVIAIWIGVRIWAVSGDEAVVASAPQAMPFEREEARGALDVAELETLATARKSVAPDSPGFLAAANADHLRLNVEVVAPRALRQADAVALPAPFQQGSSARRNTGYEPVVRTASPMITPLEPPRANPLSFSGWALLRGGRGQAGLAPGGQLGASQAGLRMRLPFVRVQGFTLAANARLSRALDRPRTSEAAFGVSVRPDRRLPVELIAERRFDLGEGGRDAWALGLAGGVSRRPLPAGFEVSAYAQAGVVGARSRDFYADGALSLNRPIAAIGRAEIAFGGELRGAAQPGLARVDAGPEMVMHLPVAGGNFRLSAGYRFRLAGNARPGSGFALTAGTDF